jgi:hypothetical protein
MKHFHLHLVSDSTGETVSSVARASLAQFDGVHAEEHVWSLVRTQGQLEKMIASLDVYPGLVMFTLMDNAMRETLRHACGKRGLPCIPVLGQVIREMGSYLDQEATGHTGAQYELGEDYFARIDLLAYFFLVHVIGLHILVHGGKACGANIDQSLIADGQAYHKRLLQMRKVLGQRAIGHERNIRRLVPTISKVNTGGRFAGARRANDDDIGILDFPGGLAVIMFECVIDGIDTGEIILP